MPFKKQIVNQVKATQKPPIAPLTGHKLAKRSRVTAVMRAQDKVAPLSRRIIGAQSLAGSTSWLTPDTTPVVAGPQTHPLTDEVRAVMRTRCDVTPGCFLKLYVAFVPSGSTQVEVDFNTDYQDGGPGGSVLVDVTWTDQDGNTETTAHPAVLQASAGTFAGAPADPWAAVKVQTIQLIAPEGIDDVGRLATWTRHVHAEVTLSHVGGARIVDAVVEEWPWQIAREVDDAADLWTSHMFADGDVDAQGPNVSHPLQRVSETSPDGDPRLGAWHVMDVADAQRLRLGPQLFNFTAYNEADGDVADVEIPIVSTVSTSFVRVSDGVAAGYDAAGPGWTVSNYARDYAGNHPHWGANEGSIPVLVAVYGATSQVGAVGELRLQASDSSWITVTIDDRFFGWWFAYGHLRCGVGPGDDSVVQALYRMVSGVGALRVKTITAYRMGGYVPAWI